MCDRCPDGTGHYRAQLYNVDTNAWEDNSELGVTVNVQVRAEHSLNALLDCREPRALHQRLMSGCECLSHLLVG